MGLGLGRRFLRRRPGLGSAAKCRHEVVRPVNQRQLADRWDVSEATMERWRTAGIGPIFLKMQGRVLYRIEDVEAYEAISLRKSTSERIDVQGAA